MSALRWIQIAKDVKSKGRTKVKAVGMSELLLKTESCFIGERSKAKRKGGSEANQITPSEFNKLWNDSWEVQNETKLNYWNFCISMIFFSLFLIFDFDSLFVEHNIKTVGDIYPVVNQTPKCFYRYTIYYVVLYSVQYELVC